MARRQSVVRQIKSWLATATVMAVLTLPALVTGWWLVSALDKQDPRKLLLTEAFHERAADRTVKPLVPFQEPIVSVTFDDGWETVYTQAFPTLQQDGVHTTQYIISGQLNDPAYMSVAQLKAMKAAGTQIGDHTVSHADLTTLNADQLKHELKDSKSDLEKQFGGPITDFTSPYGAYNAYTLNAISTYFRSQKNAEGDASPTADPLRTINVAATFNPMNFPSYSVRNTTTLADIRRLLYETGQHNGWLVLTYHQIDNSGSEFSVTPDNFRQQMALISNSNLRGATVGQVLDAMNVRQKAGQ